MKPRLVPNIYASVEPDDKGEAALFLNSSRRQIKLRGPSIALLAAHVLPLLDGLHSIQEIENAASHILLTRDCAAFLGALAEHNLIQDHDITLDILGDQAVETLEPQLGTLQEYFKDGQWAQSQLKRSTVTMIGLSGAGAVAAMSLAAASVGRLRLVDPSPVENRDCYFSPIFDSRAVGNERASVLRDKINVPSGGTVAEVFDIDFQSDLSLIKCIRDSDFVVFSYDRGVGSLPLAVNRACLELKVPWTSCATSGIEGRVGPTVYPGRTPCYLCYTNRLNATLENEEARYFAGQSRDHTIGTARETTVFLAGIIGNLSAWEALKVITHTNEPATLGAIVVMDMLSLKTSKHVILRKPWCEACASVASNM